MFWFFNCFLMLWEKRPTIKLEAMYRLVVLPVRGIFKDPRDIWYDVRSWVWHTFRRTGSGSQKKKTSTTFASKMPMPSRPWVTSMGHWIAYPFGVDAAKCARAKKKYGANWLRVARCHLPIRIEITWPKLRPKFRSFMKFGSTNSFNTEFLPLRFQAEMEARFPASAWDLGKSK